MNPYQSPKNNVRPVRRWPIFPLILATVWAILGTITFFIGAAMLWESGFNIWAIWEWLLASLCFTGAQIAWKEADEVYLGNQLNKRHLKKNLPNNRTPAQ